MINQIESHQPFRKECCNLTGHVVLLQPRTYSLLNTSSRERLLCFKLQIVEFWKAVLCCSILFRISLPWFVVEWWLRHVRIKLRPLSVTNRATPICSTKASCLWESANPCAENLLHQICPSKSANCVDIMPKSRRSKVISLTQTDKKTREWKESLFSKIRDSVDEYDYVPFSVECC
jgi:hypothetical protein